MNFPSHSAREKNEQVKLIVAGVFLCGLVIDLHTLNLMLIALNADIFFGIGGIIGRSCRFHRAMFGLFGDTRGNVTTGSAVGMNCVEKADALLCSRSDDTGEL